MKIREILKHIRNFLICCRKTTHELEDVVEYVEDLELYDKPNDSNLTYDL